MNLEVRERDTIVGEYKKLGHIESIYMKVRLKTIFTS